MMHIHCKKYPLLEQLSIINCEALLLIIIGLSTREVKSTFLFHVEINTFPLSLRAVSRAKDPKWFGKENKQKMIIKLNYIHDKALLAATWESIRKGEKKKKKPIKGRKHSVDSVVTNKGQTSVDLAARVVKVSADTGWWRLELGIIWWRQRFRNKQTYAALNNFRTIFFVRSEKWKRLKYLEPLK